MLWISATAALCYLSKPFNELPQITGMGWDGLVLKLRLKMIADEAARDNKKDKI